jgi:sulfite reductase (ferredoxin)
MTLLMDGVSANVVEAAPPVKAAPKRSAVEDIKENSRQLRGTIADELAQDADHFSEQNKQLLKFHGSYQQEDRDARKNRKRDGVGKHHMFMVRCKIPGGRLTAAQYLAVDGLAGNYGYGTLRFTTRQGIQLHGVLKDHLRETIAGINQCLLTTLGACGDVERNVMACPAPHHDGIHAQLQETAATLAANLAPRSRGYHEIWLNGKPVGGSADPAGANPGVDLEPLYGKVYLPRKFKTGLTLPEDNCIDIHAQDLGLLAIVEDGVIAGFNVLVGGGMGMTHGNANTFPHLARPICYVPARAVVTAAEAVVKLFRDHGNRADRKRARIKYLVHDWGVEKFRQVLSEYIGAPLAEPRPIPVSGYSPHHGWNPQGNGKWYFGLSVENGRVKDDGKLRLRTGLRTIIERFQPALRLTPLQDILLCDLDASARPEIDRLLAEHGIARPEEVSPVRRFSMACPAVPTCGLAISESERVLPKLLDDLEIELKRLGLADEKLSVRMTGCPNGCARPYQSDIGIVGRSGDKFTVFVGGRILGDRLNFPLRDLVPQADIVPLLVPLLETFKRDRQAGESFGEWCLRQGLEALLKLLPEAKPSAHAANRLAAKEKSAPGGTNGHPPASKEEKAEAANLAPLTPYSGGEGRVRGAEPAEASSPGQATVALVPRAELTLRRRETFLQGPAGSELSDYRYVCNSDGSVRQTVISFYGNDLRAKDAHPGDPLWREAAYAGQVDAYNLHAARKLSDTYFVGPATHEIRDQTVEYHPDGRVARTIVYYYDGDLRAGVAPSGTPLRREVTYEGRLPI